jgi:hypothetical protein
MVKYIMLSVLPFNLSISDAASARDSLRLVCSGFGEIASNASTDQIGISIDFLDTRAKDGSSRNYIFSSIYHGKLFQGKIIDKSGEFPGGKLVLQQSGRQLYIGKFEFDRKEDRTYSLLLMGKINKDYPSSGSKLYPVKAILPCVDLSI